MNLKTLRTATGKEFDILWDGASTIDFALRFAVVNSDIDTVHNTFKSREETHTLTRIEDGIESVYAGYTMYAGFRQEPYGNREIIVTLAPEE